MYGLKRNQLEAHIVPKLKFFTFWNGVQANIHQGTQLKSASQSRFVD